MLKLFPHWFTGSRVFGAGAQQSVMTPLRWKAWNRTGAVTVKGQLCSFDMGFATAAETTQNSKGELLPAVSNLLWQDPASAWRNLVVPTAPYHGHGYCCVVEDAVADNEEVMVTVIGDTYMNIKQVQGGTAGAMLVTGANWTDASKTVTQTGSFTSFVDPGSIIGAALVQLHVTAGTGVTPGDYTIATKTDNNNITLSTDINGAGGNIADSSVVGELYITMVAGAKIEAATTLSGGNITNGTSAIRKIAMLAEQTKFTNAITLGGGQSAHVLFNGFGFGPRL